MLSNELHWFSLFWFIGMICPSIASCVRVPPLHESTLPSAVCNRAARDWRGWREVFRVLHSRFVKDRISHLGETVEKVVSSLIGANGPSAWRMARYLQPLDEFWRLYRRGKSMQKSTIWSINHIWCEMLRRDCQFCLYSIIIVFERINE